MSKALLDALQEGLGARLVDVERARLILERAQGPGRYDLLGTAVYLRNDDAIPEAAHPGERLHKPLHALVVAVTKLSWLLLLLDTRVPSNAPFTVRTLAYAFPRIAK